MAPPVLHNIFLLLVFCLPFLVSSKPVTSNALDRGNGLYVTNAAGEITEFVPLDDILATTANITSREPAVSPLDERALAFKVKCFSAKFDKNDKRVGIEDIGYIMDRYPTLSARHVYQIKFYSAIVYACNYSKVTINVSSGTSVTVNKALDVYCRDNVAARGDYGSGISYGRTAAGKPYCKVASRNNSLHSKFAKEIYAATQKEQWGYWVWKYSWFLYVGGGN